MEIASISGKLLVTIAAVSMCRHAQAECAGHWAEGSGLAGLNGAVYAMTIFDDGTGEALYVGGDFTVAGKTVASNIAKWNGSSWTSLGSGTDDSVRALTVFDDGFGLALYAGGRFRTAGGVSANHIAKWNGSSWSALGTGMSNEVLELTVFDDGGGPALYAGGWFTIAGGVSANYIAKWAPGAPGSWSGLGSGMNGPIYALTVFDDGSGPALYAGGFFYRAGDVKSDNIAKWNGSSWSALGSGIRGSVFALTIFDDGGGPALYVGGSFFIVGSARECGIAKWNGSSWSDVGFLNHSVRALAVFDDGGGSALFAGGWFSLAEEVKANRIARWNGSSWSTLGSGLGGTYSTVDALKVFDDAGEPALYVGGNFTTAGNVSANGIAQWSGWSWSSLGSGTNGSVRALTVFDDGGGPELYAGGSFTNIGGVSASQVARWNGSSWSPLGTMGGDDPYVSVSALTDFDNGGGPALYAGGNFTTAGGESANYIAKWDGASWSGLGSGMNGPVYALTVFDDGGGPALYAGGCFTTAGDIKVHGIAKWDGFSWSTMASAMSTYYPNLPCVYALTVFHDGGGPALYAGGNFITVAGLSANGIAKWNGSSWSALGTGLGGTYPNVGVMTVFDDGGGSALYAGGSFATAGGVNANNLAKWDGLAWSALGSEIYGSVGAMTVFDDGSGPALYAGGYFTAGEKLEANHIARWNPGAPGSWSALGSGMNGNSPWVQALTVFDDGGGPALYAGGDFTIVDGRVSAYIAKWSSVVETNEFINCLFGPNVNEIKGCNCTDRDLDGDVDLADFKRIQNAF